MREIISCVILTVILLLWTHPASGADFKGYTSVTYENVDQDVQSYYRWQESLHLSFKDQFMGKSILGIDTDTILDQRSDRSYSDFLPSGYLTLQGEDYHFYTRYSEFENKGYQEGGNLKTDTIDTTLRLTMDKIPEMTLSYSENNSIDQLDPHLSDNTSQTKSIITNYPLGTSKVFLTYSEQDFINRATGVVSSTLLNPAGIAVDGAGNIYAADRGNNRIVKFDSSGNLLNTYGSFGGGDGQFNAPEGVAIDSGGNIYVADTQNNRVQKLRSDGTFLLSWGRIGSNDGEFLYPEGIAVDSNSNVYVADTENHRIQKFDSDGNHILSWGSLGSGNQQFSDPAGIAIDSSDNVYVADTENHRIMKFDSSGNFITKWGSFGTDNGFFSSPEGIAVDGSFFVYVADTNNHRVQKFDSFGTFITKWGGLGSGDAQFSAPQGITADRFGFVYAADTLNNRVQKFQADGTFLTKWGGFETTAIPEERQSTSSSLGYNFSLEPFEMVNVSGNYSVYEYRNMLQDILQSETLTQNISIQTNITPMDKVTLSARFSGNLLEFEDTNSTSESSNITESYTIGLEPYNNTFVSTGYTTYLSKIEGGSKSENNSVFINFSGKLTNIADINTNYSNSRNELDSVLVSETDAGGISTSLGVRDGIDLNLAYNITSTKSIQSNSKSLTDTLSANLYTTPTRKSSSILSYNISDTRTKSEDSSSKAGQENLSFDLTYKFTPTLFASSGIDYYLNKPDSGDKSDEIVLSGGLSWRWKEWLDLYLSYLDRQDTNSNQTLNGQMIFRLKNQTYINLSHQIYNQEESTGNRQVTYIQVTKSF